MVLRICEDEEIDIFFHNRNKECTSLPAVRFAGFQKDFQ